MGDSNFFCGFGDKSTEELKQFEIIKEKQVDNDINKSYNLERELALLMEDDEDDELKVSKINLENENSYLSSFSNFMKNNLSSIISENNNNNITNNKNQILENEDKANYNISNISNNFPPPPQNFNSPIYENNIPTTNNTNNINNNFLHLSKYSFGSINDKIFDYDKNYSKNNNIININNK